MVDFTSAEARLGTDADHVTPGWREMKIGGDVVRRCVSSAGGAWLESELTFLIEGVRFGAGWIVFFLRRSAKVILVDGSVYSAPPAGPWR